MSVLAHAQRITNGWGRWLLFQQWHCCDGHLAIVVSQMNLDMARRIARGEMIWS